MVCWLLLLFGAACQPYPDQERLIENPSRHFYDLGKKRSLEVVDIQGDERSVTLVFNQPLRLSAEHSSDGGVPLSVSVKPHVPIERVAEVGLAGVEIFFARPLPRSRDVELRLSPGLRAASGASLTSPVNCRWRTPRPSLVAFGLGGEDLESGVPSRLPWDGVEELELVFDQPVTLDSLQGALSLWNQEHKSSLDFEVLGLRRGGSGDSSSARQAFSRYRVRIPQPSTGEVRLRLGPGLKSTEGPLGSEQVWEIELYQAGDLQVEEVSEEGLLRFNQGVDSGNLQDYSVWLPTGSQGSWEPVNRETADPSKGSVTFRFTPSTLGRRAQAVILLPGLTSVNGGSLQERSVLYFSEAPTSEQLPVEEDQGAGGPAFVVLPESPAAGSEVAVFGFLSGFDEQDQLRNTNREAEKASEPNSASESVRSNHTGPEEGQESHLEQEQQEREPDTVVVEVLDHQGQSLSETLLQLGPRGTFLGRIQVPGRPGQYVVKVRKQGGEGEVSVQGQVLLTLQSRMPSYRELSFRFENGPKLGRPFEATLSFEGGSRDDYQILARIRPAAQGGGSAPGWERISEDVPVTRSVPVKTRTKSITETEIEIALPPYSDWAEELQIEVVNVHSGEVLLSRRLPILDSVEPLQLRSFSGLPRVEQPYTIKVLISEPEAKMKAWLTGNLTFQALPTLQEGLTEWKEIESYRTLLDDSDRSTGVWELAFAEPGRYRLQTKLTGESGVLRSAVWETLVAPSESTQSSESNLESIFPEFELDDGNSGPFRTTQTVTLKELSRGSFSSLFGFVAFEPIHWETARPPSIEVVDLLLNDRGEQELTLPSHPGWYRLRILASDLEGRRANFQRTMTLYTAVEARVVAPLVVRAGDRFRAGLRVQVSEKSSSGVGVSASSVHQEGFEPLGFHHSSAIIEPGASQDLLFRYQIEASATALSSGSEIDLGWSVTWPGRSETLSKRLPVLKVPTYGKRVTRATLEPGASRRFDVDKIANWGIHLSTEGSAQEVCEFELRGPQGFLGRHKLKQEWGSSYYEAGRGPGVVEVELLSGPPLRAELLSLEPEPENPRSPRLYLMRSKGETKDGFVLFRYRAVNPEALDEELLFRLPLPGGVQPVFVSSGNQGENRPIWWLDEGSVYFGEMTLPAGEHLYEIWAKPLAPGVYLWPAGEISDRSGNSMAHSQSGSFQVE